MSFLSGIEKLKSHTFLFSFLSVLFLIVPGASYLFLMQKDLFLTLEISKLLLLSVAIVFPIICCFLSVIVFNKKSKLTSENFFHSIIIAIFYSGLIIYTTILVTYFADLSFKHSLFCCLAFLLFNLFIIYDDIRKNGHFLAN